MKAAMVLVLLTATSTQVACLPYMPQDGVCLDAKTQYLEDASGLCCSRCRPGTKMKQKCSETADTACQPCPGNQFMENWNYSPNCFACSKCLARNGLQFAQPCSPNTESICRCKPGMYCTRLVESGGQMSCSECMKYPTCKPGYGLPEDQSSVTCSPCPEGKFSNKTSISETCKPHTDCQDGVLVRAGNATVDAVCLPPTTAHPTQNASVSTATGPRRLEGNISRPATPPGSELPGDADEPWTKRPPEEPGPGAVAVTVTVVLLLALFIIVMAMLVWCKVCQEKDGLLPGLHTTNGNTELIFKDYGDAAPGSLRALEHQGLLDAVEPGSHQREPSSLRAEEDFVTAQPASGPHVNVNITVHIENGHCVAPAGAASPAEAKEEAKEEEFLSAPQQEAGKHCVLAQQESDG